MLNEYELFIQTCNIESDDTNNYLTDYDIVNDQLNDLNNTNANLESLLNLIDNTVKNSCAINKISYLSLNIAIQHRYKSQFNISNESDLNNNYTAIALEGIQDSLSKITNDIYIGIKNSSIVIKNHINDNFNKTNKLKNKLEQLLQLAFLTFDDKISDQIYLSCIDFNNLTYNIENNYQSIKTGILNIDAIINNNFSIDNILNLESSKFNTSDYNGNVIANNLIKNINLLNFKNTSTVKDEIKLLSNPILGNKRIEVTIKNNVEDNIKSLTVDNVDDVSYKTITKKSIVKETLKGALIGGAIGSLLGIILDIYNSYSNKKTKTFDSGFLAQNLNNVDDDHVEIDGKEVKDNKEIFSFHRKTHKDIYDKDNIRIIKGSSNFIIEIISDQLDAVGRKSPIMGCFTNYINYAEYIKKLDSFAGNIGRTINNETKEKIKKAFKESNMDRTYEVENIIKGGISGATLGTIISIISTIRYNKDVPIIPIKPLTKMEIIELLNITIATLNETVKLKNNIIIKLDNISKVLEHNKNLFTLYKNDNSELNRVKSLINTLNNAYRSLIHLDILIYDSVIRSCTSIGNYCTASIVNLKIE